MNTEAWSTGWWSSPHKSQGSPLPSSSTLSSMARPISSSALSRSWWQKKSLHGTGVYPGRRCWITGTHWGMLSHRHLINLGSLLWIDDCGGYCRWFDSALMYTFAKENILMTNESNIGWIPTYMYITGLMILASESKNTIKKLENTICNCNEH